jgi:allantoate deiminase
MNIQSEGRAKKVMDRCRKLAGFSEEAGRTTRTFLSPPMRDCHREIAGWLEPLGADVKIDAAGNLRGLYPAAAPGAQRLLIGSHLDTVPNGGAYDGVLGVVLAVALLEELRGQRLLFGIEVVGFSEEEGARFGTPFIGSRALVGRLDEELLKRKDVNGICVRQAIEDFGLKPSEIPEALVQGDAFGFLEFHIEQGPVLEQLGRPLGVVEAIAGQSRLELTFIGRANHAGTTPMELRHDAIAGAAEWITFVEREAQRDSGLVATVGQVEARPGATNVIAGEARMSLDVRHGSDETRTRAVETMTGAAEEIAERRGLSLRWNTLLNQKAVAMDSFLVRQTVEAIRKAGCEPHRMVSGAGHDAMILAEKVPSAMIFLRTPGGISHAPEETVEIGDVAKALESGLHLLDLLASSHTVQRRMRLAKSWWDAKLPAAQSFAVNGRHFCARSSARHEGLHGSRACRPSAGRGIHPVHCGVRNRRDIGQHDGAALPLRDGRRREGGSRG